MIDKITLKNRESGNDAFPYTWDSIVGRTGGTTVKDALDALEAGTTGGGGDQSRAYDSTKNVQGYMVLQPNTGSVYAQLVGKENYIIEVRDIIDLDGENITMPEGCTLKFVGGKIINGTLVGTDTVIDADPVTIFGDDLDISGKWNCEPYAEWFDYTYNGVQYNYGIQKCLDSFKGVCLRNAVYEVFEPIIMPYNSTITGSPYTLIKVTHEPSMIASTTDTKDYEIFYVFSMGLYCTVKNIKVYTEWPVTVFRIGTENMGATYKEYIYLNADIDEEKGEVASNTVLIENVQIRQRLARYHFAKNKANEDLNHYARCIHVDSNGNYLWYGVTGNLMPRYSGFWGIMCKNVSVAGYWDYVVWVESHTSKNFDEQHTLLNSVRGSDVWPWVTDCTFDTIHARMCYNFAYIGRNDEHTGSYTFDSRSDSRPPQAIKFLNCSMQMADSLVGDYGCLFGKIDAGVDIAFRQCIPWDFKRAGNKYAYEMVRDYASRVFIDSPFEDVVKVNEPAGAAKYGVPYTMNSAASYGEHIISDLDCMKMPEQCVYSGASSGIFPNIGSLPSPAPQEYSYAFIGDKNTIVYNYLSNGTWVWSTSTPQRHFDVATNKRLPYGIFSVPLNLATLQYFGLNNNEFSYTSEKKQEYLIFRKSFLSNSNSILEVFNPSTVAVYAYMIIGKEYHNNNTTVLDEWIYQRGVNSPSTTGGLYANRPLSPEIGTSYYITDSVTLIDDENARTTVSGIPLYYNGSRWADSTGTKHTLEQTINRSQMLGYTENLSSSTPSDQIDGTVALNINNFEVFHHYVRKSDDPENANYEVLQETTPGTQSYLVSELIPVTQGMVINVYDLRITKSNASKFPCVVCFDSNEELITTASTHMYLSEPASAGTYDNVYMGTFTVPSGVSFIRFQYRDLGTGKVAEIV